MLNLLVPLLFLICCYIIIPNSVCFAPDVAFHTFQAFACVCFPEELYFTLYDIAQVSYQVSLIFVALCSSDITLIIDICFCVSFLQFLKSFSMKAGSYLFVPDFLYSVWSHSRHSMTLFMKERVHLKIFFILSIKKKTSLLE